jgi:3-hydroxyacyl-CoA dehydrogenase/3a,7a,12a-trihydroxy-5b-cholest-24-enoyl-CoA hydratase
MASQKLGFLQKIDQKQALEAIQKKRGSGGGAATSTATATPTSSTSTSTTQAKAPGVFKALAERLAKNPGLAGEVRALLQFDVTGPDASWVVDLTGPGSVREGTDAKATARLRIADADLVTLTKDPQAARDLYQHGTLRVDGDVRVAQKLAFLKDLA